MDFRVLLHDDGVRALGYGRAGEDADGLAWAEGAVEALARRRFADPLQGRRHLGHVARDDGVAVHGGDRGGGMGNPGGHVPGEHPAEGIGKAHLLGRQGLDSRKHVPEGFFDGDHSASKVPDLPPALWTRRMSVMRMERSAAFSMS